MRWLAVTAIVCGPLLALTQADGPPVESAALSRQIRDGTAPARLATTSTPLCLERATRDRVPIEPGPTVHMVYAIPLDGEDRLALIGPRLEEAARSVERWWLREDPRRAPRFDRYRSPCGMQLDVTTYRLDGTARSYARLADVAALIADEVATSAPAEFAIILVAYDGPGGLPDVCGQGGGSLNEPGVGLLFVNACPEVADDLLLAHELVHALGALPEGAPHPCPDDEAHPCDDPTDVLWPKATEAPLADHRLDAARDDYYGHAGEWADVRDSIYLRRVGEPRTRVTLRVRGAGLVSSPVPGVQCSSTCVTDWDARMEVPLAATARSGRRFVRWEGACAGADACTIVLRGAPLEVHAVFAPPTLRLALAVDGRGSVRAGSRWVCKRECARPVRSFAPIRLRALPATGWRLARWEGACRGREPICVVPMERMTTVRVVFAHARDAS
jgi:hypothetical protein